MPRRDPFDLVGTTLVGKYAVEAVVDEGGFSVVYRARHMVWNRLVAIKAFKTADALTGEARDAMLRGFIQEGAILAELSERSTAICQARDVATVTTPKGDWVPFMVLEWLDGEPLETIMLRERDLGVAPRTLERAVRLLEPVARALALAHARGIVHCDVKPGNLFVLRDGGVKLLDFGIANIGGRDPHNTGMGPRSFTPSYGAPEQFWPLYGATSPATDVFAMALMTVELVCGDEALVGDDVEDLARQSSDPRRRPTPRTRGARVSDEVEAVFARALAVEPAARYADARVFWSALRRSIELAPLAAIEAEATTERRPRTQTPAGGVEVRVVAATLPSARPRRRFASRMTAATVALALAGATYVGYPRLVRARHAEPSSGVPALAPAVARVAPAPLPAATCPDGMVRVPDSRFIVGSDDGPREARPAHAVHVQAFCIDRFEVTTRAYEACADRGACARAGETNWWPDIGADDRALYDALCNAGDPASRAEHPINCVEWESAAAFCAAGGARLPSEAEWEVAARGPDGRAYPWGDGEPTAQLLNACGAECVEWGRTHHGTELQLFRGDDAFGTTAPVGSFPAGRSPYGIEDAAGNVWEWTSDRWAFYDGSGATDDRVIRGGAWNSGVSAWVSSTYRVSAAPATRSYGIGFRCAR
jgi:formylglycine-generating enzyme required for sulfatase activity